MFKSKWRHKGGEWAVPKQWHSVDRLGVAVASHFPSVEIPKVVPANGCIVKYINIKQWRIKHKTHLNSAKDSCIFASGSLYVSKKLVERLSNAS